MTTSRLLAGASGYSFKEWKGNFYPEKIKPEEDASAKKERDAARQLKYVKVFVEDGKKDLARKHCNEIIEKYPGTKAAKEAGELLEKLKE